MLSDSTIDSLAGRTPPSMINGRRARETIDLRFTPQRAGDLVLEVTSVYGTPIVTLVPVRVRPRDRRSP